MKSFPFSYEDPNIEDLKIKYFLTISALISDCENSEKIYKIQDEILGDINASNTFGSGIYKCPRDRIHFSIINFNDLSYETCDRDRFEKDRQEKIDKIKTELVKLNKKFHIIDNSIDVAYIYPFKSDSIGLQAFPSKELCELFSRVRNHFENMDFGKVSLKGFEYEEKNRFVINLVRYYRKPNQNELVSIKNVVQRVNDVSLQKGKLFTIKLKAVTFVLSDNALANEKYEQLKVDIV